MAALSRTLTHLWEAPLSPLRAKSAEQWMTCPRVGQSTIAATQPAASSGRLK